MKIYAIGTINKQKIGVSNNVAQRLATLQTGNSEKLSIHSTIEIEDDIAFRFEKFVHRDQSHRRILGEWFDMNQAEVKTLFAYYEITLDTLLAQLS
tara:strand:+ start:732 stop:1019 length:288 start_codon:yes stop_codon:yes gene_type:complete